MYSITYIVCSITYLIYNYHVYYICAIYDIAYTINGIAYTAVRAHSYVFDVNGHSMIYGLWCIARPMAYSMGISPIACHMAYMIAYGLSRTQLRLVTVSGTETPVGNRP